MFAPVRAPLVAIGIAVSLAACAGSTTPASVPTPAEAGSAGRMSNTEIEAIYRDRIEASRTRFTEADVRFMTHMIHHHAQAIEISGFASTRTTDPQILTLTSRIINAQQDEIATMQRWLAARGQPIPELHAMGDRIMVHMPPSGEHAGMDHGTMDMSGMPGILSEEQVTQLHAARGAEFDRLFLTFMIEHHNGAVTMVRELFATDGAGQDEDVFRFASDVQVDQTTEVARMERMLEAMTAGGGGR